jgi:HK97 family phage major capsid protein
MTVKSAPKIEVRGHRFLPAYGGRGYDSEALKTGNPEVDDKVDEMVGFLTKLLADAIKQGQDDTFGRSCSVDAAVWSAVENGMRRGTFFPTGDALKLHRALDDDSGNQVTRGFRHSMHLQKRSLTSGVGAGSVANVFPPDTWYDALRSRLVLREAGATFFSLPGDRGGNVAIPVTKTAATIGFVSEGSAPAAESNDVISQVLFTPHTATCHTDVSINMLKLGMPGFTDMVISHLINGVAVLIDQSGLNGTGLAPQGLLQGINANAVTPTGAGNTILRTDLVQMVKQHAEVNADSLPNPRFAWLTSASGRGTLMNVDNGTTASATGTSGRYVWESHEHHVGNGEFAKRDTILGRPAFSTTNIPGNLNPGGNETAIVYGDMQDFACNIWPTFSILVNPFLLSTNNIVRISIFCDFDWQLIHAGSFVPCVGWVTTY